MCPVYVLNTFNFAQILFAPQHYVAGLFNTD